MHINKIYLSEHNLWVSYDLEIVNKEIMLNATFTRNGEKVHKIHKLRDLMNSQVDMIVKLRNYNFAIFKAKELIESANRSKHSPFLKY